MTIEEYARAVAEAVQLQCGLLTGHPVIAVLDTDAIIASVPKPEGCPACKYYHGLPAPDVQAQDTRQDTRPPCNCPRDYAQYLGDDPHNRWCPRSRNPHPEVIQAQIDAARAEEREAWERRVEAALEDYYGRTFYTEYQRLECVLAALHALVEDRARSGARGAS